jgi:hypothetical protein
LAAGGPRAEPGFGRRAPLADPWLLLAFIGFSWLFGHLNLGFPWLFARSHLGFYWLSAAADLGFSWLFRRQIRRIGPSVASGPANIPAKVRIGVNTDVPGDSPTFPSLSGAKSTEKSAKVGKSRKPQSTSAPPKRRLTVRGGQGRAPGLMSSFVRICPHS